MASNEPLNVGGRLENLPVHQLRLDSENPRFGSAAGELTDQFQIALELDKRFDPLRVAVSIAEHGFFISEPLIAVEDKSNGTYIVVEGNRRLTALKGLSDPALRDLLARQTPGWKALPEFESSVHIPVIVAEQRSDVDAILGFRHISGIEPWDPFSQARFVHDLVDSGNSIKEVARIVGRPVSEVQAMYRDFDILIQAREEFGLDTSRAERSFGVFNAAMNVAQIRTYVGAPTPSRVDPTTFQMSDDSSEEMRVVLGLIFGSERNLPRVITDSRHLRDLGRVLADQSGEALRVLVTTGSLDEAKEALGSADERLRKTLVRAARALENATRLANTAPQEMSPEIEMLLAACQLAIEETRKVLGDRE
jgi:hypothetical protein